MNKLLFPEKLISSLEILAKESSVPKEAGIYAWYFKQIPPKVPTDNCVVYQGHTLLYVGISPKAPPQNGKPPSKQTLWNRLRYHLQGNAEGSTLRLTIGCLLSAQLGIELRRVGSGKRMTFGQGEDMLSKWMEQNAFATWCIHPTPWIVEEQIISSTSLPLNLAQNKNHPFHSTLSMIRKRAKQKARELPVI